MHYKSWEHLLSLRNSHLHLRATSPYRHVSSKSNAMFVPWPHPFYTPPSRFNPLHAKYAYMRMGVVKKRTRKKKKKMFHSWDQTRDYRIDRLVSCPLGHQGSWVFYERLCSYSLVNRVNYDMQIKHSACKGLRTHAHTTKYNIVLPGMFT